MKKDIVLNPYTRALGRVMRGISFICFAGAIALSAFFYNLAAQEFLAARSYTHPAFTWGALGLSVVAAGVVAIGIKYLAAFLFFCLHAARTGRAREKNPEVMPTIKRVAFFGLLGLLAFEGYAAFKGGDISAKLFAPKVQGITASIVAIEQQNQQALAPLRAKVLDIEAQIHDETAAKSKGLEKLLKKGNGWAEGEYKSIAAVVAKSHANALKSAKAAYDAEAKRLANNTATAIDIDGRIAKKELADAEQAETFYGAWLKFAALLCLGLGLLMEYALAANETTKYVRPLTDAEALALEADREAAKGSSFVGGVVGAVRGLSNRTGGGRAPDPNNQPQGNSVF
jgi:hypothetical protein